MAWLVRLGISAGVLLGGITTAVAQDHPAHLRPTIDVEIEYRTTASASGDGRMPGPDTPMVMTQHIYMKAGAELIRGTMDTPSADTPMPGDLRKRLAGQYMIMDLRRNRMTLVYPEQRMYAEAITKDLPRPGVLPSDNTARFARVGSDTVAGHPCTIWSPRNSRETDTACITDDGVMLRMQGTTKTEYMTINIKMEAVSVKYGRLPNELFEPPPGYSRLEMPAGMPPRPQHTK